MTTRRSEIKQRPNARGAEKFSIRSRIAYFVEKPRRSGPDIVGFRESGSFSSIQGVHHADRPKGLKENDIVIALVGSTGSGKSTFARSASGSESPEGSDGLTSRTNKIVHTRFRDLESGRYVVLVDTPGFNSTFQRHHNLDILKAIVRWLRSSYNKSKCLSGILYFHPMTDDRTAGSLLHYTRKFKTLLGGSSLSRVYLTTTMWDNVGMEAGERVLEGLKKLGDWKAMIERGAHIVRCIDDSSPKGIVRKIIDEPCVVMNKDELEMNDIVIAVVGPTGSGRTTFIRSASGSETLGGSDKLKSDTNEIIPTRFRDLESEKYVVLVDTAGFGDTFQSNHNINILDKILGWLQSSYEGGKHLSGIVYLHNITENRSNDTLLHYLGRFRTLLGANPLDKVYLATTMWDEVEKEEIGERRLEELKTGCWKAMIDQGAHAVRCKSDDQSPKRIVRQIIDEPFVVVNKDELGVDDIVIAVIGPTGSGRTTFIRSVSGSEIPESNVGLKSETNEIIPTRFRDPGSGRYVVLVDTTGFNNTFQSDHNLDIMGTVLRWLRSSYEENKHLSCILYLHRINDNRANDTLLRYLKVFRTLLGTNTLDKLYLATTMWDEVKEEGVGEQRLEELKAGCWKAMIGQGAQIACCRNIAGNDSPKGILRTILNREGLVGSSAAM